MKRSGKPYKTIIFNIHKLIGLATFVFLIITIYNIDQVDSLSSLEIFICIVIGLFFLIAIISGGIASIYESIPKGISIVHMVSPFLTVLSVATILYFLLYT